MHQKIHLKRLTRPRRTQLLAAAALASGILVAGCGGSANTPTVASVGSPTTSTSTAASTGAATTSSPSTATTSRTGVTTSSRSRTATTSRSSSATRDGAPNSGSAAHHAFGSGPLAFSKCMRANGVPNYPDPSPGGGIGLPNGLNPNAPAFRAAQAKCSKLVRGFGGLPGSFSGPPPSPQALAHWVKVAQCMRRHGIYQFPDPRTTIPSNPLAGGAGVISDRDGVILVFPATIDMQSPLFTRAAATCGFQLTNH
jgi:hypothetical protein